MKRVIAAIMCIAILVSMCVFTASATEIVEVKNAEELRNALTGKSGVIVKLTQDIVLNDGLGLAYSDGVITVTNGQSAVAKIETGENGTTIGKIAEGSLDSLNKWTPLATLNGNTIDGAGHKIVGMVVTVSGGAHGAFVQKIQNGESIKDLTFENSLVISAKAIKAATAVCDLRGDLINVNAKNAYVVSSEIANYGHAGGLVDTTNSTCEPQNELYNPTVKDCSFDGLVVAANGDASHNISAGGVVAQNVGGKIVNCVNYGKVVTVNGKAYGLGGVVGIVEPTFGALADAEAYLKKGIANAYVINCANYGEISKSAGKAPGGVIGFIDPTWSTGESIVIGNLYNGGKAKDGNAIIANCGGVHNLGKKGTFEFKNAFADKDVLATTGAPTTVFQSENIKALSVDEALAALNSYASLYSASFGAYGWSKVEGKLLPDPKAEIKPYDGGEKLEITGVKVLNDRELEITFSGNAKKVANVYSGIRYTNDQFGLQYDGETPLQFDCGLRMNGSNKAIAKLADKYNGVITMAEILAFKGYETKGYKIFYCIEEATKGNPNYQVSAEAKIDSITSPNGLVLLEANKPNKTNPFYDGVYTEITDQQNASVKFTTDTALPEAAPQIEANMKPTEGGITITSVKAINATQLEFTFSEPVKKASGFFNGIRYVDKNLSLQKDPAYASDSNKQGYLQFMGSPVFNGTNKVVWTFSALADGRTLYDILTLKGYESKGYFVTFCIEGLPNDAITEPKSGFVDNITSLDGTKLLSANVSKQDGVYDDYYVLIEDIEKAKGSSQPQGNIEADMTPTEGGITITSVKAINATQLEITFSEPVKKASNFFNGIRYVDKNLKLQQDTALTDPNLQFYGTPVFNGTNKVVWTLNAAKAGGKSLYEILTCKGYESKGYFVTFCIEGLETTSNTVGYIDNITSLDGTKLLSAVAAKKDTSKGIYDGCYALIEDIEKAKDSQPQGNIEADMTPTEGGITIKSVKAINETQLEITFSEPVKKHSGVFSAIRYVDKNLALGQDKSLTDPNLQFSGSLTYNDTEKVIWTYGGAGLYDILKLYGYEDKGYFVTFCIEGLPNAAITEPKPGFIDNITSLDGTKLLSAVAAKKDTNKGIYDGCYAFIEDIEKAKGEEKPPVVVEGVEVLSAKVLNEREIEFTFSEQVQLVGGVFNGIRYTDASLNLQTDTTLPTVNPDFDKYLQFTGGLRMNGSNKAIFKLSDTAKATKGKTLEQIIKFDGYEEKGYKLYFCFEGLKSAAIKDAREGYVDNIQNDDGTKRLIANKPNKDCIFDGCYVEITDLENATKKFTSDTKLPTPLIPKKPIAPETLKTPADGIKLLSAKIINASQIELTFSEAVKTVGSVFSAIRYVDSTLKLGRDESRKDPNLQWWGTLAIVGTNKAVWTMNSSFTESMENVLKLKGYEDSPYYVMFCIEGLPNAAITNPKAGYVDNITSTNGKKLLGACKENAQGIYDGVYVEITGMENIKKKAGLLPIKNRPNFTLKSCKVINSQQIELIFSEPVKKESNLFAAIRYTNDNMVVQKDGDTYLQFSGSLKFNDTERVVWTVTQSGGKTLYELLTLKGYEKSGYKVYFCLEGLPTKSAEVGYIDNITSLDGKKLLKCTEERASANGSYDGLYVKIADIDKANVEGGDGKLVEGITVESIVALDDYKLELTFSDPIYLVGTGTQATQYNPVLAAVRYVNPVTYEPVKYNDKKLEFAADFYANDGELTAEFELRSKETTLRDLFAKVGYEDVDAIPMLVLQGTDDEEGRFDLPLKGFIDNIQSEDGKKMLVAMKESDDGIADAWFAEREEINFEGKPSEEKELLKLVNKDKMNEAQKEAFAKLSEEELTAKLAEAKSKIDAMSKTLSESGEKAFNALLKKNKIDNPESVKAFKFSTEPMALDFPVKLNIDVKDRGYGLNDKLYVYRVDENGKVEAVDTNMYSSFASDGAIGRIEVYTDKLGDFFVTNAPLEVNDKAGIPVFVWAIIGGVIVLAGAAVGIVAAGKKKKATK